MTRSTRSGDECRRETQTLEGDASAVPAHAKSPPTVLAIDDEKSVLLVLKKRLTAWGYRVVTAGSGQEGLAALRKERPDVVITDLAMPGMDGLEILARVTREEPETPVIILSGRGELGDAVRALRLGAWDYIVKPLEDLSFLLFSIEGVLEKARLVTENRRYREHLESLVAEKTAELAEREAHYRTVADFTYDWEYWIDPAGRVAYMSPSCSRVTGYRADEIIDNPALLNDMIHPEDRRAFTPHLTDNAAIQGVCDIEFRISHRDGTIRWIGHHCHAVRTPAGRYMGRRCSNRDITYRKEIEHRLIAQQRDLVNQTIKLERANEALRETNFALKALLDQRETEKRSIEQTMVANLKRFVCPYLEDLGGPRAQRDAALYARTLEIIRTNIEQLVSPVSRRLSGAYADFTPTEIRVADLIRQGATTKTIAGTLNTSTGTVAIHRNKIRKKLAILHKKVNLRTYLNSLG